MEELVQYYVVNKEIEMSLEKFWVQIGHAATISAMKLHNDERFLTWFHNNQVKILLGGKEKDLLRLIEQGFDSVRDLGRTEVAPNSLTVVVLPPMTREEAKVYTKRLQLYHTKKDLK